MQINKSINFTIESLRKIPNPYNLDGDKKEEMYVAICDVQNLPADIPMKTNPRDQNLNTTVAKKIKNSLLTCNDEFYLLNRGLLVSVSEIKFNNYTKELTLDFTNDEVHGNIDGGHTYKIILENRMGIERGKQFVKIEILLGVEDMFQDLADARNTSTQVRDQSIAELRNQFEIIKKAVEESDSPILSKIYYKENEEGDIDIRDLVAILSMFNLKLYPTREDVAVSSYSRKQKCLENYLAEYRTYGDSIENPYVKMSKVMPDILELYDCIEANMARFYRERNASSRYGAIKGVGIKNDRNSEFCVTRFYRNPMDYMTPNGFIYPILGAFRSLLKEGEDGYYYWKQDPKVILEKTGADLVYTTIDRSRTLGNNPQSVGKDSGNWKQLYLTVLLASIDD